MEKNFRIQATKLLAVEGKDECNFFESLLRKERMDGIQLVDIGGKDKFQIILKKTYPVVHKGAGATKENIGLTNWLVKKSSNCVS